MTALTRAPRVAVVLPVFNGEKYLSEAIGSVLHQTYTDFELLVVDDGSTDGSADLAASYADSRVRVLRLGQHRGLVTALNTGIAESRSELIARMDADDICLPERFERQVAFLDANPEIGLCGTWVRRFGDEDYVVRLPSEPEQVRAHLFFGQVIDHPSIMFRRSVFEHHGLAYDDAFRHLEDYDLFTRAAEVTALANLPEVLLLTRAHAGEVTVVYQREQEAAQRRLLGRQLRRLMPEATDAEESLHAGLLRGPVDPPLLDRARRWLLDLDRANQAAEKYDAGMFRTELRHWWYELHCRSASPGMRVWFSYWKSALAGVRCIGFSGHARLLLKCLTAGLAAQWWSRGRELFQRLRAGSL